MPERMLQFPHLPQHAPDARDAGARRQDFGEIYPGFPPEAAAVQSSRCSQCGIPFCAVHCPLGNDIPDWLKLTAEGRLQEAYEISAATNNFPEICGRICPQDRLCEGNCVIDKGFGSVTIGAVERFLTDHAWTQGWVKPASPLRERGRSIGIVGAGPAGLAAAEQLRGQGYAVHVYDRHDRVGGLLVYGIPNFKLDKAIVARREALLRQAGIQFHLRTAIGRDVSLEELRSRHDAVLIATGVYQAREVAGPGSGLGNIVPALDFLIASNRRDLGDAVVADAPQAGGKHVVVLGGGDTAMDCLRTAVRQGAASVTCLYRRDRANMPGSMREVRNAEEEGVRFVWLATPEAFTGEAVVQAIRARQMRLGLPDASGRASVEPHGEGATLPADLVIKALGFDPEPLPALWQAPDLHVSHWGTLAVDRRSLMTSIPGVFAAGDIVRGASLVVWAIRDGRDAAARIHAYVQQSVPVAA